MNLERRHAFVKAGPSKNRKAISVPLTDDALVILQRQIGKYPPRVFTYAGKPLASANTSVWLAALMRAGIEDFRWYYLRHAWATWHRMAGTPTHELQRLGGWKLERWWRDKLTWLRMHCKTLPYDLVLLSVATI